MPNPRVARIHGLDDAFETIGRLLRDSQSGEPKASAQLLPLLYQELRRLARSLLSKKPPGQTLQPTALVHEAYLRLTEDVDSSWDSRGHFFAAAAQAMREILVDEARRKDALKRGGDRKRTPLDEASISIEAPSEDLLALDEALKRLELDDPRKGRIVSLRYFAGLTIEETAQSMGISTATVEREWRYVRVWLQREISGGAGNEGPEEPPG